MADYHAHSESDAQTADGQTTPPTPVSSVPSEPEANAPLDTISGVTKELFEARSAGSPEAQKKEKIIGAIAIAVALVILALFAFNS